MRERYGLVPHGTPELDGGSPPGRRRPRHRPSKGKAATDGHRGDPPTVRRALRAARPHGRAVGVAAARRPEPAVRQRRHGAVQALLPRPGDAAVRPRGQRAEVRAHPRHRGRRQDHPARHVLRDVRQLLLRRLLQGRRHRARLGPGHPADRRRRLRAARGQALPQRLRRRRRGGRALEEGHRAARRPDRPARARRRTTGRWACPGRAARARRSSSTAARRTAPTATSAPRTATWSSGTSSSCRTSSARSAAKEDFDIVGLAAEEEHRHRHGPRAGRVPAPGQGEHVRDRRHVPGDRAGRGAHRPPVRRRPRRRRPVPRGRRPRPQRR